MINQILFFALRDLSDENKAIQWENIWNFHYDNKRRRKYYLENFQSCFFGNKKFVLFIIKRHTMLVSCNRYIPTIARPVRKLRGGCLGVYPEIFSYKGNWLRNAKCNLLRNAKDNLLRNTVINELISGYVALPLLVIVFNVVLIAYYYIVVENCIPHLKFDHANYILLVNLITCFEKKNFKLILQRLWYVNY